MTKDGCTESESLKSNHEEADTRMCIHARVAAENGADHIVISSPDTDVLVLLLHHLPAISASKVFFFTRTEEKHADLTHYTCMYLFKYMIALRHPNSTFYCSLLPYRL